MPATLNPTLQRWNALEVGPAADAILPCNGSRAWSETMAAGRPFDTPEELLHAADDAWQALRADDRQQAFDSHPRLGEQQAGAATAQSLAWSRDEQSAAQAGGGADAARLAEANRRYEQKFGRIFLLCATGKSAGEILRALELRMANDKETEWQEAGEQQRKITQLRLRKWLDQPLGGPRG